MEERTPGIHYRHELKFVCSEEEICQLKLRITGLLPFDAHAEANHSYLIRSIYFDDYFHTQFYQNENGISPRAKWRIRAYNCDKSVITLERKVHEYDRVYKESCPLTEERLQSILEGRLPISGEHEPLLNRFLIEQQTTLLRPDVIVQYQRIPYVCELGNVRITFDQAISSSQSFHQFFSERLPSRPVLPSGKNLLEVKYDEYIPDVVYEQLDLGSLQRTSFSKYYLCKRFNNKASMLETAEE